MIKEMKENLLKRKTSEGFTLVEIIVAMGIFAIITPFIITIMTSAIQMRDVSKANYEVSLSSSFMSSAFTHDIETADYIKTSKDKIEIRSQNTCILWFIDEYTDDSSNPKTHTALYRNTVIGAPATIPEDKIETYIKPTDTYEPRVVKNLADYSSEKEYFTSNSENLVSYSIPLNSDSTGVELKGSAQQSVASAGPGNCFN